MAFVFGSADVGNPVTIHFENFAYATSSNTLKQYDQRW